jgi:hypothetical protein
MPGALGVPAFQPIERQLPAGGEGVALAVTATLPQARVDTASNPLLVRPGPGHPSASWSLFSPCKNKPLFLHYNSPPTSPAPVTVPDLAQNTYRPTYMFALEPQIQLWSHLAQVTHLLDGHGPLLNGTVWHHNLF